MVVLRRDHHSHSHSHSRARTPRGSRTTHRPRVGEISFHSHAHMHTHTQSDTHTHKHTHYYRDRRCALCDARMSIVLHHHTITISHIPPDWKRGGATFLASSSSRSWRFLSSASFILAIKPSQSRGSLCIGFLLTLPSSLSK